MKRTLFIVACGAVLYGLFGGDREVTYGPGVVAPREPRQEPIEQARAISFGDYELQPRARFEVEARVLSTKRYRFDREADLAPIDFALGWGRMSDEGVLDQMEIWQRGRWFRYRVEQFPIPQPEITASASNMHLIPASRQVRRSLFGVAVGEVVRLEGHLVDVRGGRFSWNTSLTRTDTGAGACELFYVERVAIVRS